MVENNKTSLNSGDDHPHIVENSTIFSKAEAEDSIPSKKKRIGGYGKLIVLLSCVCTAVAVAITCTLLFWETPENDNSSSSANSGSIVLISKDVSADKITVKNPRGEYTLIKYTETVTDSASSDDDSQDETKETTVEKYKLDGYDRYPIDNDSVTALASAVVPLAAESKVSGEWTDKQLGLDSPEVTVTVGDTVLIIGKQSGMGEQRYCRILGDEITYLVAEDIYDTLCQSPADFADTTLIEAISEDDYADYFANGTLVAFDDILIEGANYGDEIKIVCLNSSSDVSSFAVISPKNFYADMTAVEKLLSPISSGFNAEGAYELVSNTTDFKMYGLDTPEYIYTYKLGKSTFKIELSKAGIVDEGIYACRVNGGNVIYKCNTDSMDFLIGTIDDLRSSILFSVSIKEVDVFTVSYGDKKYSYDIGLETVKTEGTEKEQTVVRSMDGKKLDAESFQNIYMALASVSPTSYAEDGGFLTNTPYLSITLKMTDGKTQTVKFIKYDDRYYRMYLNDIGDQLINYTVVDRLISYFDDFSAGKQIDSPAIYD